jgi:hypothetical protein
MKTHSNYHSYLLRLWQVQGEAGTGWRASLEDVQTGELRGFQDVGELLNYLDRQAFTNWVDKANLKSQVD